jgi:putative endopeptidase
VEPGRRQGFAERTAAGGPVRRLRHPQGKVSGKLTLGENIADLGGLATAYDAMKAATAGTPDPMTDGLSRDQRFFLNWATVWRRNFTPENLAVRLKTDPHAPADFRAIGAPSTCRPSPPRSSARPATRWSPDDKKVVIW